MIHYCIILFCLWLAPFELLHLMSLLLVDYILQNPNFAVFYVAGCSHHAEFLICFYITSGLHITKFYSYCFSIACSFTCRYNYLVVFILNVTRYLHNASDTFLHCIWLAHCKFLHILFMYCICIAPCIMILDPRSQ